MKGLALVLVALLGSGAFAQQQAEVIDLLKSDDWDGALVRIIADGARLTSDIIHCLRNTETKVRARAANALRVIDSAGEELSDGLADKRPAAVGALKVAARDSDKAVRRECVWALAYLLRNRDYGRHGEPWSDPEEVQPIVELGRAATEPLIELIADKDSYDGVNIAAVRALAAIEDPAAVDGLISLVKTAHNFLLSEAMKALIVFDDPRIARLLIDRLDEVIGDYSGTPGGWALAAMKGRAVPDLLWAVINHPNPAVRAHAVSVFEFTHDPRVVPVLHQAAIDADEYVRACVAWVLAYNPHPSNTAVLLSLLSDTSPNVRAAAVGSLGSSGEGASFDAVAACLSDPDQSVRRSAASALAVIDKVRAVRILVPLIKDPELQDAVIRALTPLRPKAAEPNLIEVVASGGKYARNGAANLLGVMKSAAAVPALLVMLQSDDWYPRSGAARALGQIGKPSVDGLLKLLPQVAKEYVPSVLEALGPTGDTRAFEAIEPFLQDNANRVHAVEALGKTGDKRAIPLIIPYLSSADGSLLRTAVEAAGDLKANEAVPLLIKALSHEGDYVASNAAAALGKIGDARAFDSLLSVAQDPEFGGRWMAIEALGAFPDPRSVPTLIMLLGADWPDCAAAARALGKIGDRSAIPALENATKSEDETLASDAKEAIGAIRRKR